MFWFWFNGFYFAQHFVRDSFADNAKGTGKNKVRTNFHSNQFEVRITVILFVTCLEDSSKA